MKTIVILSLIGIQVMVPKTPSKRKPAGSSAMLIIAACASLAFGVSDPTGGARGKTAGAESTAADVSGAERIYGGDEAIPHEFPFHLVVIKDDWYASCGAVIIDKEWALTAGHCAASDAHTDYFTLYAGKHDKTIPESTEQKVGVVQFIRHEEFENWPAHKNDITLIKVSPSFQFNEYVQKVVLPKGKDEQYSTGMATAVGWGSTENDTTRNVTKLRKVSLPLMTNERCQKLLDGRNETNSVFPFSICAGAEKGKDSCVGDSGGPLVFMEDGRHVLIGLVSWGVGCADEDSPGVYTRVSEFLDWIANKTGLELHGRADAPLSDGETSRGLGAVDARAKISNDLAQTMCKGYDDYHRDNKLSPAVKVRPKTPAKCGWAKWSKCKGQDGRSCKPFTLVTC